MSKLITNHQSTLALISAKLVNFAAVARYDKVDPSTVSRWFKANAKVEKTGDEFHFLNKQNDLTDLCFISVTGKSPTIIVDGKLDTFLNIKGSIIRVSNEKHWAEDEFTPDDILECIDSEYSFEESDVLIVGDVIRVGSINVNPNKAKDIVIVYENSDEENEVAKKEVQIEVDYSDAIWTVSKKFITISFEDKTYTCDSGHSGFENARTALIENRISDAIAYIDVRAGIENFARGNVKIEGRSLYYEDVELKSGLAERIVKLYTEGKTIDDLLHFLENVMSNPTRKTVYRLFDFLRANDIEITKDGYFTAWKVVTSNFKDCHTRTIDNSIGVTVEMPRHDVEDDDSITCSSGLHVCSRSYIRHFANGSDRLVKVKVHPADVVSIPVDYNDAKMRVCKYTVLEEVTSNALSFGG